jgi:hypothetical protein
MMLDTAPHVVLLLKMEELGKTVDYLDRAGIAAPVTVRHSRNRKVHKSDKPSITLIFVSDDAQPAEHDRNLYEQARELKVDIQADIDLDTEDSNLDPTGLDRISKFIGAFVGSLKTPDENVWLDNLCDTITIGALNPDDRSTPDDGRMTREINVLYRVRSDDANVLLAQGVNG